MLQDLAEDLKELEKLYGGKEDPDYLIAREEQIIDALSKVEGGDQIEKMVREEVERGSLQVSRDVDVLSILIEELKRS